MLTTALEKDGYRVEAVGDGAALIEYLSVPLILRPEFRPPDLVITDHRMPVLTGIDALSILRRGGWTFPTILITAFGDRRTHEDAKRLGASCVLDKPFELTELRKLVAQLLEPAATTRPRDQR